MDHDFVIKRQTIGLNQPQTFVFIKEKEKCNKHCIIYTDAALSFVEETIYDIWSGCLLFEFLIIMRWIVDQNLL